MEDDFMDTVSTPCSSLAVETVIRLSTTGIIWGACFGSNEAKGLGFSGMDRALFTAKSAGKSGLQFGLFGTIFSVTDCGLQRYRGKTDWVNKLAAGVVAGAAIGAGSRNWKQAAGLTGIFCSLIHVAKENKSF